MAKLVAVALLTISCFICLFATRGNGQILSVEHIPIQQCLTDDRATGGVQYSVYIFGCNVDCQCFHGAPGGTCNFETNKCHCDYPSNSTFESVDNSNCPYCTRNAAAAQLTYLFQQLGKAALGLNTDKNAFTTLPTMSEEGGCW